MEGVDDPELEAVVEEILAADPDGSRTSTVLRDTLDQLYDGQRTGRYQWDQLHKTEKTHCGTLVEINMQREFKFADGDKLDYRIAGVDVDCKYSMHLGRWMVPIEARGELLLGLWADDLESAWSMGVVRASEDRLTAGGNRDLKASLNQAGKAAVRWLFDQQALPENTLLHLPAVDVEAIMSGRSGQARVNELFRRAQGRLVGRGVVATVAQQADPMKRVRGNRGARSALRPEGIVILGQFASHQQIAEDLGLPIPGPGESVSARLAPAELGANRVAEIEASGWRLATDAEPVVVAPVLPSTSGGATNLD